MEHAKKIVAEFEEMFGRLTATERDWLTRRIAQEQEEKLPAFSGG